jgi:hypothetical protein
LQQEQKFPERSKQLKASRQNMQVIFDKLDPSKKDQEFGTEIDGMMNVVFLLSRTNDFYFQIY